MWVRDNKVWYEAELIEKVKSLLKASCGQCKNCEDFDDCAQCGKLSDAQTIEQVLDLIQENEDVCTSKKERTKISQSSGRQ